MDEKIKRNKIIQWAILLGLGILLALAIIFYPAVYRQFDKWKLTPGYEPYTELYFNNYRLLPNEVYKGEEGSFDFTIHNVEGTTVAYPWTVYFVDQNGKRHVFKSGNVTINNNDSVSITAPYKFTSDTQKGTVVILLKNLNQQIDFVVPKQ